MSASPQPETANIIDTYSTECYMTHDDAAGRMRIFKTKPFARFASREKIADAALIEAVRRAERGIFDADLGGGVIKQRIARAGQGKSGGFRSIILFRRERRAYFVYGFAKSVRSNIREDELEAFRRLARELLELDDAAITAALANGTIVEVMDHDAAL